MDESIVEMPIKERVYIKIIRREKVMNEEKRESKTENLDFGQALKFLKKGCKLARKGWNGKNMFIKMHIYEGFRLDFTPEYDLLPYIEMKTVDNKLVPWLASQTDILAEDYFIVE